MQINISEAKGQLLELIRLAEEGEDIILLRRGLPVARLVPVRAQASAARRHAALTAARGLIASDAPAARSQDFLYGDDGLPA